MRDGKPWLDDARIARAIRDLEQAAGHRLMEINQSASEFLLKDTVAEGLPDWEYGRPQPIKFIDFENPANNDFLVINQFKVELTSGRWHVIPDTVLFVNGIPLVVAEFKSPGIENPLHEAVNQLLRYSNQRRELFPTLYSEKGRSTGGGRTLLRLPEEQRRSGPVALLCPNYGQLFCSFGHLLDLIRNFTVFQQVDGKTRKVMARYQQFRAVQKAVTRLQEGRSRAQGSARDERGGIIWHTREIRVGAESSTE